MHLLTDGQTCIITHSNEESFLGFPDWLEVMLTVATDQSFLTLQTHPQQLQLVVMTVLETLQLLQLLTGVDGDDPLVVTEGGVHAGDEAPPAGQPAPVQGTDPQADPVPLQLQDLPAVGQA